MTRTVEAVLYENELMRKARIAEKERCLKAIAEWSAASRILLHAGEMTAQELQLVKAVVGCIYSDVQNC